MGTCLLNGTRNMLSAVYFLHAELQQRCPKVYYLHPEGLIELHYVVCSFRVPAWIQFKHISNAGITQNIDNYVNRMLSAFRKN